MAVVLEMPLKHPARRENPYHLRTNKKPALKCPFGCEDSFEDHGRLYLHLLGFHPGQHASQTT